MAFSYDMKGIMIISTIARVGRMGREGMRSTDEEILEMMLEK